MCIYSLIEFETPDPSSPEAIRLIWQKTALAMKPQLFITLTFNKPTSAPGAYRTIKAYDARMNDLLLGRRWDKKPFDQRIEFVAFPDHMNLNFHYHVLMHVPPRHLGTVMIRTKPIWKELCPSGSTRVDLMTNVWDLQKRLEYATRNIFCGKNLEEIVLSRQFSSKEEN